MYITSTGPLEEKKLFAGQGLAGSHANFSRYVSNTRNRLPRRTAKLISSHSIYSFSSFGNILNSNLYFAFHFHIRCGSHVDLYVKGVTHSDESTVKYYPTPQLRKRFSLFQRLFWPLSPQLHCIRSLSPYSWMYFQEQQGSKNPPYSQVVSVAKRPNIYLASRNQNRTKVELVLVLHSSGIQTHNFQMKGLMLLHISWMSNRQMFAFNMKGHRYIAVICQCCAYNLFPLSPSGKRISVSYYRIKR